MKLQGFSGTGSGKLGSSVFAVRNGEQIVRQYQKYVLNPKSESQRQQRAKIKLASQVAAALSPVLIGFRNLNPGVSQRNGFVSMLFKDGAMSFDTTTNKASMNAAAIKLTNANVAYGNVSGVSGTGSTVSFNVYAVPEFLVPGSLLTAVVIRPVASGGVEYIGRVTVPASTSLSVEVPTVGPVQSGDRLVVYMTRPQETNLTVNFLNAIGDAATGSISLEVVVRQYVSILDFSRSNNFAINVS